MNTETLSPENPAKKRRFTGLQVLGIVAAVMLVTVVATVWAVKTWFFPSEFKPVALDAREEMVLEQKLERLEGLTTRGPGSRAPAAEGEETILEPEPYSEVDARREIHFSERELNALLARNTNLASRLAIDLSDDLASARLLIPLDEDFPVLGGKTIRVATGLEISFLPGRPVVKLRGVSIMGVPVPNAWLGNLKNVDLVEQYGSDQGFWKAFSDGVEFVRVQDGELFVKLKE